MWLDEVRGELPGVPACAGEVVARLQALAEQRAEDGLAALVAELGDLGFSWRDVACTAGVALSVLHRWHQGAPTSGGSAERTAMLVALCKIARGDRIDGVAGRLEAPIDPAVPVTGMDLVANDRFDLVLWLLTNGGEGSESILDEFEPGWREHLPPTSSCSPGLTACLASASSSRRVEGTPLLRWDFNDVTYRRELIIGLRRIVSPGRACTELCDTISAWQFKMSARGS